MASPALGSICAEKSPFIVFRVRLVAAYVPSFAARGVAAGVVSRSGGVVASSDLAPFISAIF